MRRLASARFALLIEIAVPIFVLVCAEVGARQYLKHTAEPPVPRLFPFPITTSKFLAYRREASKGEEVDVALLGLSQMQMLSALEVEDAVAETGHDSIRVFNFAAAQQWVELNRLLLRDILSKIRLPRAIVYGFIPNSMLFEKNPAATLQLVERLPVFDSYRASPGAALERALLFHSDLFLYREVLRDRFTGSAIGEIPA